MAIKIFLSLKTSKKFLIQHRVALLVDANHINILVTKFRKLITFSNKFQIEQFKSLFCNLWKDLSNIVSLVPIGLDLTSEIVPPKVSFK
jgi:hypothetical protein